VLLCHFWSLWCSRLRILGFACVRTVGFSGLDCVRLPAYGHICCQVVILVLGCSCVKAFACLGGLLCHFGALRLDLCHI